MAGPVVALRREVAATALTVVGLVAWDVLRGPEVGASFHLTANLLAAALLAVVVVPLADLRAEETGLARDRAGAGLRWGLAAAGLVVVVVTVGVLAVPDAFDDPAARVGRGALLFETLVDIPVGTVVLEEVAFRGVLLALLLRRLGTVAAVSVAAVLFGLWHVPGVVADGAGAVVGTALATTAAGVVFAVLRLRSGSLVAPVLAHWATNALALVAAWLRWG